MAKSPLFSVRAITTTSFAAAMFALSGCSVGLQAEGSADYPQLAEADLEVAILDAIERTQGASFADALRHDAPDLTPMTEDSREEPVVVEEPASKGEAPETDMDEEEAPVEEPPAQEEAPAQDEAHELASSWSSVTYIPQSEDVAFGIFADMRLVEDGSAQGWAFGSVAGADVEQAMSGRWAAASEGTVISMEGASEGRTGEQSAMVITDLVLSDSCEYALGGSIEHRAGETTTVMTFSAECDSCFGLSVNDEDLGKVCLD